MGSEMCIRDRIPNVLKSSPGKKFPRPDPGSPTVTKDFLMFPNPTQKKVPPARSRFPHALLCSGLPMFQNPDQNNSSTGPGQVPPPLWRISLCFQIQHRKKVPRPNQDSPIHCYVAMCLCVGIPSCKNVLRAKRTVHHDTSRHVLSFRAVPRDVTSNRVHHVTLQQLQLSVMFLFGDTALG